MRPDDGFRSTDDAMPESTRPEQRARPAHEDPRTAEPAPGPTSGGRHAAPDDVGDRPLIDLARDPHPGVPDHAAPDDAEDGATGPAE